MNNPFKCLFCDELLYPAEENKNSFSIAYNCKSCGEYGFSREFEFELNTNSNRVRKWAIGNRTPLLDAIRYTNSLGKRAFLKSDYIDAHLTYIGPNRTILSVD